jgi:adenylosuccinate lyase
MSPTPLTALSPLDGRYHGKVDALRDIFSEFGLIQRRVQVELAWLKALSECADIAEVPAFSSESTDRLDQILAEFDEAQAEAVKAIEATTNHDVKAVEYFLKDALKDNPELSAVSEFVHFGCTSEDINNLAHALMIRDGQRVMIEHYEAIRDALAGLAQAHAEQPMLSRTHGQAATPTTLGKELANVVMRLNRQLAAASAIQPLGKMNGAVGNYNAHQVAYPDVDWPALSERFVAGLGYRMERLHHPDRAPRLSRGVLRRDCPAKPDSGRLQPGYLVLHLTGLLQAADGRRGSRLLHHAA